MYSCRPVNPEDYPSICAFPQNETELFYLFPQATFPLTVEQIAETSNKRLKPTVILNEDGRVIGYANLYNHEEERCWLGNVVLAPECRGTGAAEFLISHMKTLAKNELGTDSLHLSCHNMNTRGLLFYSKLEFKPYGLTKISGKDGQPVAIIRMKIDLQD